MLIEKLFKNIFHSTVTTTNDFVILIRQLGKRWLVGNLNWFTKCQLAIKKHISINLFQHKSPLHVKGPIHAHK